MCDIVVIITLKSSADSLLYPILVSLAPCHQGFTSKTAVYYCNYPFTCLSDSVTDRRQESDGKRSVCLTSPRTCKPSVRETVAMKLCCFADFYLCVLLSSHPGSFILSDNRSSAGTCAARGQCRPSGRRLLLLHTGQLQQQSVSYIR